MRDPQKARARWRRQKRRRRLKKRVRLHPLFPPLQRLAHETSNGKYEGCWISAATDLLAKLNTLASDELRSDPRWPSCADSFGRWLSQNREALFWCGIRAYQRYKKFGGGYGRCFRLWYIEEYQPALCSLSGFSTRPIAEENELNWCDFEVLRNYERWFMRNQQQNDQRHNEEKSEAKSEETKRGSEAVVRYLRGELTYQEAFGEWITPVQHDPTSTAEHQCDLR